MTGFAAGQLIATFSREGGKDVRIDKLPALQVPSGEPATPFLKAGKFEVVWTGSLELKQRQRLEFSFGGEGSAVLLVAGKEVHQEVGDLGLTKSKSTRLNPGFHEIEVRYESKDCGGSTFRLYWEEAGMVRQTIPPGAFSVEITAEAKLGELQRHGRLAFSQQHCAKCHVPSDGLGATAMPEMGEIGPILAGIGGRVSEDWLRKWIADPKALKPTTHMPQMVDPTGSEGLQQSADLAAYLASLNFEGVAGEMPDAALARSGGVHFHELGCVACHLPPGSGEEDPERVPLNNVALKYLPGQLVEYLKKPDAYHPFTKMPDFGFSEDELVSLAAFLTEQARGRETEMNYEFPEGDAARGERLMESLQCGVCHPGSPGASSQAPDLDAVFRADWTVKGCVSEGDTRAELPVLNLRKNDREALVTFSGRGSESLKQDSSAEFAKRQLLAKNCVACHTDAGDIARINTLHAETVPLVAHIPDLNERLDQSRPHLTFVGEMLYASYIESILDGSADPRPRPWLGMRMPAFHTHTKGFAEGLSRLHGVGPGGPVVAALDVDLVSIGEKLTGAEGFGCTTCHGLGEVEPTAAFEVGAVNFSLSKERLRPGFYQRWMDNPQAVTPGSKMPRYAEGNRSQRGDILEGDAAKQYEAIWQYLQTLR